MFEIKEIKTEVITEEEFIMEQQATIELVEKNDIISKAKRFIARNNKKNKKDLLKNRLKDCVGYSERSTHEVGQQHVNINDYMDLLAKYKANQKDYDDIMYSKMDAIDRAMAEVKRIENNKRLKNILNK